MLAAPTASRPQPRHAQQRKTNLTGALRAPQLACGILPNVRV